MLRTVRTIFSFSVQAYNPTKNYYKILNVSESASQENIKSSFKVLAKRYHPDFNKGKEEQFKQINEAYQVLSDQTTKAEYDQARRANTHTQDTSQNHRYHHPNPNQANSAEQTWQWQPYSPRQQFYSHYHRGPYGYEQFYAYNRPNYGPRHTWGQREQELYELYRQQQQDFMNRYQQSQREKFQRRERTPMEEEYMRRLMEELMAREEIRRSREEMMAEKAEEERLQREKLQRQLEENKRKLKMMGKAVVDEVKGFAKTVWNIFLDFKGKK